MLLNILKNPKDLRKCCKLRKSIRFIASFNDSLIKGKTDP
jgi:hypothetical protein